MMPIAAVPPRSGPPLRAWAGWVGLGLAVAATVGLAWHGSGQGAAAWVALSLVSAVALVHAAYRAGRVASQNGLRAEIHALRQQLATFQQLQEGWAWRTDARHRLASWQAPAHLPVPAPTAPATPSATALAWEFFQPGQAEASQAMAERMQSQAPLRGLEVRPVPDGPAWRCDALPCLDAQGLFSGYVGVARPATAMTAPALAALAEATQAEDEQAAFNYTVSHDLRAPVRVVEGFTRILKEDYGRLLDRIGNDHLDRVLSAAARMNSMIDAMLALARLSTQPLARQPVNLSQMAEYVIDDLRRAHPERRAVVQVAPGLVVHGDPTLLRQVMENLLGNAWKYTGKRDQAHISFGSEQRDGRTLYWVQDNGAGFDMRYADRLFGAFQRLHGANEYAGTGVGLASVRRILRRHGGDIWAQAEPEHGARFEFTLGG